MSASHSKLGRIAFITTPRFRGDVGDSDADKQRAARRTETFIYEQLYQASKLFSVLTTGRTHTRILEILEKDPEEDDLKRIAASMDIPIGNFVSLNLDQWRNIIQASLERSLDSFAGMINIAFEMVEGRLDAVIHLTDWQDKAGKPDSAVLSREANVHDIPIASDPTTARTHIRVWNERRSKSNPIFKEPNLIQNPPLEDLTDKNKVLAIVAHDKMKSLACQFLVEHADVILRKYDYVLATGTTGGQLRQFLRAKHANPRDVERIRLCYSGPKGGDIQIAEAVVRGVCKTVVFFQDPTVSHAHDSDIRLFEQAVLHESVEVELATNSESAKLVIGVSD